MAENRLEEMASALLVKADDLQARIYNNDREQAYRLLGEVINITEGMDAIMDTWYE